MHCSMFDLKRPFAFPEDNQIVPDEITALRADSSLL